jgi:hypothetical protein
VPYTTERQARAALAALQRKQTKAQQRVPNAVYGCKECSCFHITSHGRPGSEWAPRQERKQQRQSEWITVRQAAQILGVHMSAVPKMVRRGDLTPRSTRPRLERAAVEALRDAREARRIPAELSSPRPPDEAHVWLPTAAAAAVVGCSKVALNARARRGRIPSVLHEGRRWYRLDHLELWLKAQAAQRAYARTSN